MRAPADYDSVANGKCFDQGVPLFWRNACIGYNIHDPPSRKISYEEAANLISTAFTRWTGATCLTDGGGRSRASIDVRDLGPAFCEAVQYKSGVANQNIILFRDDEWKHGKQVLGLTTVVFNPETGEIFNADMEINMKDMDPLALRDPVDPNCNCYDFLAVVTHEAGHFLGIGHSDKKNATMFARYDTGQTFQRNLSPDDISAICTAYRPDGNRTVLTGEVTQAPGCDPTPRGGFSRECEEQKPRTCGGSSITGAPVRATLAWPLLALGVALGVRRLRRRQP